MAYGANAQFDAARTGEPGNAPAWKRKVASAATIRPSRRAPIRTVFDDPAVGPVAQKTSSRVITIFTGAPALRDSV